MVQLVADKKRLENENKKCGKLIISLMEKYKHIGVFRTNDNYSYLMKWVESLFCFFEYKNSIMIAPTMGYSTNEEKDINNYDALIFIEVKLGQEKNDIKYKKINSFQYGKKYGLQKLVPALLISYELTFTDEKDYRIFDYIDNGAIIIKCEEKSLI